MFHVGQKVVCVTKEWSADHINVPVKGRIYTIRQVAQHKGETYFLLCEVTNPMGVLFEPQFRSDGFRPVVERKTDISIFQAMLNPKHEQVSA